MATVWPMAIDLPDGRYLTCAISVSPDYGGQTRALLMRNRLLASEAGVRPLVLSFGPASDMERRREVLYERKLLIEGVTLLNIYEHYRDHGWVGDERTGEELPDYSAHLEAEEAHPDGSPWRRVYRLPGRRWQVHDYLRQDGTPYLRSPHFVHKEPSTWPTLQRIDADGAVVGEFDSPRSFFQRWVRDLTANDARAFVFIDSRFMVPFLVPMTRPNIHLVYLMHGVHIAAPRRWNSRVHEAYQPVLARIAGMDAMVTLTDRQREDIAARRGRTNNLFVVPNPVDMPTPPSPPRARDPYRIAVVARLEPGKRLKHAISILEKVVAQVPMAHLEIYGGGSQREALQAEIDSRGLSGSARLHGHDPHARDSLWESSVYLLTSSFEGYPLSTLESMSHGCPVVAYDIKYGPREQITDGVDGFLVPNGDVDLAAARVIELLRSPALVRRCSAAAIEKANAHGAHRFLSDWTTVLRATIANKPHRTTIRDVLFEVTRLCPVRPRLRVLTRRPPRDLTTLPAGTEISLECRLTVVPDRPGQTDLSSARIELASVEAATGHVVDLPARLMLSGSTFRLRARVRRDQLLAAGPHRAGVTRLRVRLVWENSSWQTWVSYPGLHPG